MVLVPIHQKGAWQVGLESPELSAVSRVSGASTFSPFTERQVAVRVRW